MLGGRERELVKVRKSGVEEGEVHGDWKGQNVGGRVGGKARYVKFQDLMSFAKRKSFTNLYVIQEIPWFRKV